MTAPRDPARTVQRGYEDRRRGGAVMMFPKRKPWRSKSYGIFVRSLPCALTGHSATEWMAVDPHHEEERGNSGMSTKACDSRQIPIRHDLHVLMESPGNSRAAVYAKYGKDPEEIIRQTQAEWIQRGNKAEWATSLFLLNESDE